MKMNLFRKRMAKRGFTLVELMIVVSVVGLILAISLPILITMRQNADNTRTEADLRTIYTAIVIFYAENAKFPTSFDEIRPYAEVPRMEERFEINFDALT
jgi:general secretion pathway protein G